MSRQFTDLVFEGRIQMHQPIQDGLEDFLAGTADTVERLRIESHLRECAECRQEVASMRGMSDMFSSLRSADPPVPSPGFYARVTARIESEQPQSSLWEVFLEPMFGKRLAFASLLLMAMLGTVLMYRETEEYAASPSPEMILSAERDAAVMDSAPPLIDRDQMLFTLASHKQ
jgi:anti-sigma factor RsiW